MSQGLCNTSESVHALLDMAVSVKDTHAVLYERLLEEARWGLNWMLRTRFGDGYRCVWTTIGLWSRNIIGDDDDMEAPAANDPFENFCAAAAEASAARIFMDVDEAFALYCLRCAKEDYRFGVERMSVPSWSPYARRKPAECQLFGQAGVAAMEISERSYDNLPYAEIAAWAKTHEVTLWSMHLPFVPFHLIDISSLDREVQRFSIKHLSELIKRGAEIGIQKFVVHPSGEPIDDAVREERLLTAQESLYTLADVAAKAGGMVAVENLPRTCLG
jgi:hypothetical protein